MMVQLTGTWKNGSSTRSMCLFLALLESLSILGKMTVWEFYIKCMFAILAIPFRALKGAVLIWRFDKGIIKMEY